MDGKNNGQVNHDLASDQIQLQTIERRDVAM